ncbi:AbrB family transcriptional regulator [Cohnella yongneupensis]|uniref:AbrB family transcriptional regulator n=1 Tax=Cohnella yongneupensis TaxID=425006 RepID=A0ABW0QW26_9BACL
MSTQRTTNRTTAIGITLLIALVSGLLFTFIHMPIPWLLGPMIGVCAFARTVRSIKLHWPGYARNSGLIIVGYAIGIAFTKDTLTEISHQLPTMVLMTTLLLLLCALIAYGMSKATGIPYPTALTGSIPGGLSQMVSLAEETKGIDMTVVTFLQVSRLMMIVVFVPLLIFSPWLDAASSDAVDTAISSVASSSRLWSELLPDILPYAVLCTVFALLARRVNFPTAFLLAPLIVAAVLHLCGLTAPSLPSPILGAAQVLIGCYVGLLLKPENLPNKIRLITFAILSGVTLIGGACGLSYMLTRLHPMNLSTSLLSLAPGGMDQMGIIAHEINANVSIVSCYQLFRTFFIFLAVPPLLKVLFKVLQRRKAVD